MKRIILFAILFLQFMGLVGCIPDELETLRLATTTSTDNSGLLDAILPEFEAKYNAQVNVIAVGTGQALALGEAGDVDVILVHARLREDAFMADGHGVLREDVMYNDFVLVGPTSDPAKIRGMSFAVDALAQIILTGQVFASRGDDSGTHIKELSLWAESGKDALGGDWYKSVGQGMGDTLRYADEVGAYTLTDRGTFLALRTNLPSLEIMVGGQTIAENVDQQLRNPYGAILINPDKGNINVELGRTFLEWLISPVTQRMIAEFGAESFGQPLFYPQR